MFCSDESNRTCILQHNTVYEIQYIKFRTTLKPERGGKANTYTTYFSTKLQI